MPNLLMAGPAGALEYAVTEPSAGLQGVAVVCHPNPLFGGTMDNKVVQTLVRAFVHLGMRTVRFNFRGVGASQGIWDEGRGEVQDALTVIEAQRDGDWPLVLAGFSFGAYVACAAAAQLPQNRPANRLVLVGPSTQKHTLPRAPIDTLVVHGELDDVVPLSATLDWARPQALPVVVVPGVGHFFHGQLTTLKDVVIRHFSSSSAAQKITP
jgi:uncharacterized protein